MSAQSGPNPSGLCECGCGEPAPIASQTKRQYGHVKGQPTRFISGHNPGLGRVRRVEDDYAVDAAGCWIWQRALTPDGYGITNRDGDTKAHRWLYKKHVGAIPEGHDLHHRCGVKACVNPAHLEPVMRAEHTRLHAERTAVT
jgi:hypothetical protein